MKDDINKQQNEMEKLEKDIKEQKEINMRDA